MSAIGTLLKILQLPDRSGFGGIAATDRCVLVAFSAVQSPAPRARPPPAAGDAIEGADEIRNLGKDGGGDDLMLRHDREFARHIRHPGGLERCVKVIGAARI
jgi:hypothetical protein